MKNNNYNLKDGIYIPSIEACWIYKENVENGNYKIDEKFLAKLLKGKMDYSFELVVNPELVKNIQILEYNGYKKKRYYTLDIINLKYNSTYKNKNKNINHTAEGSSIDILNTRELREWSYEKGFMFNGNKMTNWKRSSGKARIGDNLFLIDSIKDMCLDWARMGLDFDGEQDIASVRAYESLPLSSIIGFCKIKPENILVISDYESIFDWKLSKTWLENGELETDTILTKEKNNIFDGYGIIDKKIFDGNELMKGKSFALLRNRLTKCAGFSCNLEKFYRDYYGNEAYETATVKDIAGNEIKVKDIKWITTPSSLKIAKFNDRVLEKEGYTGEFAWLNYFKKHCGALWGICKTEKPSHFCETDDDGNVVKYFNRLSYQHFNTIPFTKDEVQALVKPEIEYMEKLKNDLDFFLKEANQNTDYEPEDDEEENSIIEKGNVIDVVTAFTQLIQVNRDFANTQVFKDFRRNYIEAYRNDLRQGKVKVECDYAVACGNPLEMLYASVGAFTGQIIEGSMKENELYCSRFDNLPDGTSIIGFRNPHVNSGNIGIMKTKYVEDIKKYFDPSENVVFLNSINYPTLSLYQGEDFDSDSNLLVTNDIVNSACSRLIPEENPIPVNGIASSGSNKKELTGKNMADIDHIISQNYIGSVVNLSQEINSLINHCKYNSIDVDYKELYNRTSRLSSLSCIEIDKAKKQFKELKIPAELQKMKEGLQKTDDGRRIKPYFFKFIGDNDAIRFRRSVARKYRRELDKPIIEGYAESLGIDIKEIDKKDKALKQMLKVNDDKIKAWLDEMYMAMDTPMDWLQKELDKVKNSRRVGTVQVIQLIKKNTNKMNQQLVDEVVSIFRALDNEIKGYKLDKELKGKIKLDKTRDAKAEVAEKIFAMKLSKVNLYWVLRNCLNSVKNNGKIDKKSGIESLTLEIMFMAYGTKFMEMFG